MFDEYGVHSHNMLTYRILDGDKSDNIAGIKGAGLKTIKKFCPEISSEENFDVRDLLKFAERNKKYESNRKFKIVNICCLNST